MKNCWAKSLGDCKGPITKEHPISRTVIPGKVRVQGFSWCKNQPKEVGISSLASHMLCKKHNNDLSDFDNEIGHFVDEIENLSKRLNDFKTHGYRISTPVKHEIDGLKLEKWFCKTLIDIAYYKKEDAKIEFEKILPVLFGNFNFREPLGLHFATTIGQNISTKRIYDVLPILNMRNDGVAELAGGFFIIRGFRFILLFPSSKSDIFVNGRLNITKKRGLDKSWNGLQLKWHHKKLDWEVDRSGMRYLTDRIEFHW